MVSGVSQDVKSGAWSIPLSLIQLSFLVYISIHGLFLCFSYNEHNWFWIPVVGPHIGAICGAFLYLLLVGIHISDPDNYSLQDEAYEMKGKREELGDL